MHISNKISPQHIAFGVWNLLEDNGVNNVMMHIASGLADRGHRIDVVMLQSQVEYWKSRLPRSIRLFALASSSKPALPSEFGVTFLGVPTRMTCRWRMGIKILTAFRWNWRALYLLEHVSQAISFRSYIEQETPDCIFPAHSGPENPMLLLSALLRLPPIVPIVHQVLRPYRKFRSKYLLLYPHADHLVGVSQGVAVNVADVPGVSKSKISAIYNPVYSDEMPQRASRVPDHPWMNDDGPPVVLAVGRLSKDKDFPTLLRAFRRLLKRRPCRLLIIGKEGRWRKRHEALIRRLDLIGSVSILGRVDDPLSYMARAAVFVLSSRREGFGNVLVEALACGCPVVSTDCPAGPAEILGGGKYGELVPVGKDDELADAIERTLDNPLPKEVLRRRAEFFSVDRAVDQYEQLIAEVVAKARSRT